MTRIWLAAAAALALAGCEKHSVSEPGRAAAREATTATAAAALPADTGAGPPRVDAPETTPTM
jgi:hypothetical protein